MKLGELAIADIKLDPKSRDDIPQILRGLQHIYTTPELRGAVFAILAEVLPVHQIEGKNRQGRSQQRSSRHDPVADTGAGGTRIGAQCRL